MSLEAGNYIANLVAANPPQGDAKSQGAAHLRLIKQALLNTIVGFTQAAIVTGTDGGTADAYTLTPATPLLAYGQRQIYIIFPVATNTTTTPTVNISGLGTRNIKRIDGSNPAAGDLQQNWPTILLDDGTNARFIAPTKNYVDQLAFSAALPAQAGNSGKFLQTNGAVASWVPTGIRRSPRASNTILGVADTGNLVDITGGTFTQTFTAAATLGNGWSVYLRNSGSGDITLQMNASETLDGLNSFVMYPNEARLIVCDGTALYSIVLTPFYRAFTASSTFVKPPGYSYFAGLAWGGGASGAFQPNGTAAPGGPGGGCFPFQLLASAVGATETITIGAGGAQLTATGSGNNGGNTSFGSWFTATGGVFNSSGGAVRLPTGSTSSRGRVTTMSGGSDQGSWGFEAIAVQTSASYPTVYAGTTPASDGTVATAPSIYGGGGGGGCSSVGNAFAGGTSPFGGIGGIGSYGNAAADGLPPGGGGGGVNNSIYHSGAGARGELRVWGIA